MRPKLVLAAIAVLALAAPSLQSQILDGDFLRKRTTPSRAFFGIGLLVAQPLGALDEQIDVGGGVGAHFLFQPARRIPFALRADLGYILYGQESRRFRPFPRIEAELDTDHGIFFAGIGPQFMIPSGLLRPYVTGSVGLSYFATKSSIEGRNSEGEDLLSTTNHDDVTFAYTGAAGLYIPVKKGLRPISIDLGARYHGNGTAEYLREGSITDNPDNTFSFTPIKSQANLITYQLGITVGF